MINKRDPRGCTSDHSITYGSYSMKIYYQSYTYLIGWEKLDRWYYGVRWANKCEPEDDLWVHYFTSSKKVHEFRKKNGEPDVVKMTRGLIFVKKR